MTDEVDIGGLAAEYVLGTLSSSERRAVNQRRQHDHALDEAIRAWERRLTPLSSRSPDISPPARVYRAIRSRIEAPRIERFAAPRRPVRTNWRAGVFRLPPLVGTSIGLAACLLLALTWFAHPRLGQDSILVAQLHGVGSAADTSEVPAFAAVIDPTSRTLTVRPIDVHPIAEKKYTLWLVQQPTAPPISLGTVSTSLPATLTWPMSPQIDEFVNFTVAISLEPKETDTGALPTGPYAFAGKLIGTEGSRGG